MSTITIQAISNSAGIPKFGPFSLLLAKPAHPPLATYETAQHELASAKQLRRRSNRNRYFTYFLKQLNTFSFVYTS